MFKALVAKDDFLFDFVKQNVSDRIANAVNQTNYKNVLSFLKIYSPSYEEVIISTLVKYADEDLTDRRLEFLKPVQMMKNILCKVLHYIQTLWRSNF